MCSIDWNITYMCHVKIKTRISCIFYILHGPYVHLTFVISMFIAYIAVIEHISCSWLFNFKCTKSKLMMSGYYTIYWFPLGCQPCDKPGHVCDPNTGQCVCPPLTTGPQCDECRPNSWGHDKVTGCKVKRITCYNHLSDHFKTLLFRKLLLTHFFLYFCSLAIVIWWLRNQDNVTWLQDSAPVRQTTQVSSVTRAHLVSTTTRTVSCVCVALKARSPGAVTTPPGSVSVTTQDSVSAR